MPSCELWRDEEDVCDQAAVVTVVDTTGHAAAALTDITGASDQQGLELVPPRPETGPRVGRPEVNHHPPARRG
ncbi:hypothetical protein GIS00_23340 [Nakamurella sp. YIM 132087]|uniref:Uncharacterized protein n=1 Tax=Nakamurella alba TaxID=2665158 RepID=A0A7K1FUJ1_9ACTN|nr:hypothetical protein [Nakamurella alba]MTD16873.1 hypothetical protein [Nakamurella alba]